MRKITKSQLEKIRLVSRRVCNGVIIKDYKGISDVAKELGISRVAVYDLIRRI
jgi:predicted DNA-binding protein YlxM (UPF0122 family)